MKFKRDKPQTPAIFRTYAQRMTLTVDHCAKNSQNRIITQQNINNGTEP